MGKLYALGANDAAKLGVGLWDDKIWEPTPCKFSDPAPAKDDLPHHIATGGKHSLVLFESGDVYAVGLNEDGRCGLRGHGAVSAFQRIQVNESSPTSSSTPGGEETLPRRVELFRLVSATFEATMLVSKDKRRMYVCGTGSKGELGLGGNITHAATPTLIPHFPPAKTTIELLTSGMRHTVVLLSNGTVYGWGASRHGQIGKDHTLNSICWSPVQINDFQFDVAQLACGKEFTIACSKGITEMHYAVVGSDKFNTISTRPALSSTSKMFASWNTIFVMQSTGVLAWGKNDQGQFPPRTLPLLDKMAAGSEHAVGLTREGIVVAWGWGEHGECGKKVDVEDSHHAKSGYNELKLPLRPEQHIVGLSAGYATTWIITDGQSKSPMYE